MEVLFFVVLIIFSVLTLFISLLGKDKRRYKSKLSHLQFIAPYDLGSLIEIKIENNTEEDQQVNLFNQDTNKNKEVSITCFNGYDFLLKNLVSKIIGIHGMRVISDKVIDSGFLQDGIWFCHSDMFGRSQSQFLKIRDYLNRWYFSIGERIYICNTNESIAKDQKRIDLTSLKFNINVGSSIDFKIQKKIKDDYHIQRSR